MQLCCDLHTEVKFSLTFFFFFVAFSSRMEIYMQHLRTLGGGEKKFKTKLREMDLLQHILVLQN